MNDLGKIVDDGWPFGTGNKGESHLEKHRTSSSLDVCLINQGNFEVEMSKNELDSGRGLRDKLQLNHRMTPKSIK